jgi:hypothetical protein
LDGGEVITKKYWIMDHQFAASQFAVEVFYSFQAGGELFFFSRHARVIVPALIFFVQNSSFLVIVPPLILGYRAPFYDQLVSGYRPRYNFGLSPPFYDWLSSLL